MWIIRSVETDLGRWMLVVAVINVDAYPFFRFVIPDLPPWGYRNRCFLVALYFLKVKRLNFSISRWKYQSSFSAMLRMEVCPYNYCWWCGYSWGLWVSFVMADESSVRVTKVIPKIGVPWTHKLPFLFLLLFWLNKMAIILKECRHFESHNSLKLLSYFEFCWFWIFHWIKLSFSFWIKQTFLLYARQTWMTHLILAISLWRVIFH